MRSLTVIFIDSPYWFQDGEVSIDEFKQAVQNVCVGKGYETFPAAFKVFIANQFKTVDINGTLKICPKIISKSRYTNCLKSTICEF